MSQLWAGLALGLLAIVSLVEGSKKEVVVATDTSYYNYYESVTVNKSLESALESASSRWCFQCQSLLAGDDCFNVSREEHNHLAHRCPSGHTQCSTQSVRYFVSTRSHQPSPSADAFTSWSVNRTCATQECKDYCVIMGTRTKLVFCNTCCNDDMCNVHNNANSHQVMSSVSVVSMILAIMHRTSQRVFKT